MALNLLDCRVGTVVDHFWETDRDTLKERQRDTIRRGIIVKIKGGQDGVSGLLVKFGDGDPESVPASELNCVYKADTAIAQRALMRVLGVPKDVGAVYSSRKAARRPKVEDALQITAKPGPGVVKPEFDRDELAEQLGMDLPEEK